MLKAAIALLLFTTAALAQDKLPDSDAYWQQLIASREAASALQIVTIARQLDAANARNKELQKEIDELRKKSTTGQADK